MNTSFLHPLKLEELAKSWILEDTSSFDYAGGMVEDRECGCLIFMKSPGILAGIPFADAIFAQLSLQAQWLKSEGSSATTVTEIARVRGPANKVLLAERIVLNVLSRASGVATAATKMKAQLAKTGWRGILAGSRKTTPGFRMVEKYALKVGGADTHRYDLSSMVMLKDNHIVFSESIKSAVDKARQLGGFSLKVEVECRSLQEAIDAGNANCDIIMLDNFKSETIQQVALTLKLQFPTILLEASGGITESNIEDYACPWVDIISSSSLVQGYPAIDFSMKVRDPPPF